MRTNSFKVKHYLPALLCFVISFILSGMIDRTVLIDAQPWAEGATNYFHHARSSSFLNNILIPDFGYWPLMTRLLAEFFSFAPDSIIPFLYQLSAVVFSSTCISLFALPYFKKIISSDFLRFLISLSLGFFLQYDLHMFINMAYFAFIPIALYFFYENQDEHQKLSSAEKIICLFISIFFFVACCSKAHFILLAPLTLIYLIWHRNNLFQWRIAPAWGLFFGSMSQAIYIKLHLSSVTTAKPVSQVFLAKHSLIHFFSLFYKTLLGRGLPTQKLWVILLLGVCIVTYLVYQLILQFQRKKYSLSWIAFCLLLIPFGSSVLNTIAQPEWNCDILGMDFEFFGNRSWFFPTLWIYLGSIVSICSWYIHRFPQRKLLYDFAAFFFVFKINSFFSFTNIPILQVDNTQFSSWSFFHSKRWTPTNHFPLFCLPINPYPWIYGPSCQSNFFPKKSDLKFNNESFKSPPDKIFIPWDKQPKRIHSLIVFFKHIDIQKGKTPFVHIQTKNNSYQQEGFRINDFYLFFDLRNISETPLSFQLDHIEKISLENSQLLWGIISTESDQL